MRSLRYNSHRRADFDPAEWEDDDLLMAAPEHLAEKVVGKLAEARGENHGPAAIEWLSGLLTGLRATSARLAMQEMENIVALRPVTYLRPASKGRIYIAGSDGQERVARLAQGVPRELIKGQTVLADGAGGLVVDATDMALPKQGRVGTFDRFVDENNILVHARDEWFVLGLAEGVATTAKADGVTTTAKLARGDRVVFCENRKICFYALPRYGAHDRFVPLSEVSDVTLDDLGSPPWIWRYLLKRSELLLYKPEVFQRFNLRPGLRVLATGPSGVGKTIGVRAFVHDFSRLLGRYTGRDATRCIRIHASDLLSPYFGESEAKIEQLFSETFRLASELHPSPDGPRQLPVVLVLEEFEGLATRRGGTENATYDRVLGTLLQQFDYIGNLPLIVITTTNRPELLDGAMATRLGGIIARFGRLASRAAVEAVLAKKITASMLPAADSAELRCRQLVAGVAASFFTRTGDAPIVEITTHEGQTIERFYRDFLTPGLIDAGVGKAIDKVLLEAADAADEIGLTYTGVVAALRAGIDAIVEQQLSPINLKDYCEMPADTRILRIRRLPRPAIPPPAGEGLDEPLDEN